jgi:hypothetical protein
VSRAARLRLVVLLLACVGTGAALADPVDVRVDRHHAVELTLNMRLVTHEGATTAAPLVLAGRSDGELRGRRTFDTPAGATPTVVEVRVRTTIRSAERASLAMLTRVTRGDEPSPWRRSKLPLAAGSTRIVELWGDGARDRRVVAVVTGIWSERVEVEPAWTPGDPIDLVVEILHDGELVERHALRTLVGEPARLTLSRSGRVGEDEDGDLQLDLVAKPIRLISRTLDLSVELELRRDDAPERAEGDDAPMETAAAAREEIGSGGSISLPLPGSPDGAPWTARVRAVF